MKRLPIAAKETCQGKWLVGWNRRLMKAGTIRRAAMEIKADTFLIENKSSELRTDVTRFISTEQKRNQAEGRNANPTVYERFHGKKQRFLSPLTITRSRSLSGPLVIKSESKQAK
jgi:hypothetical protein